MKKLFKWVFDKYLLKYYLSQQNKPITLKELDYAFTDSEGQRYYEFTMNQAISMKRLELLKVYIAHMEMRLNPENMDLIIDEVLKFVEAGIKEKNNAARASALLLEIKDRKERIVQSELIYNYLAILYVREDEDPMDVDNNIHMAKVDMFMNESSKKDSFFFRLKELKQLFDSLTMSEEGWQKYTDESRLQGKKLMEKVRVYTTG